MSAPTRVYRVSPSFWFDHAVRFDTEAHAKVIKRGKFCAYVELDALGYQTLLDDADFYCNKDWGLDPDYKPLVASAGRVYKVLTTDGPPEVAPPEPSLAPPSPSGAQEVPEAPLKGSTLGWCLPGAENHDRCRHAVDTIHDGRPTVITCSCDCHE